MNTNLQSIDPSAGATLAPLFDTFLFSGLTEGEAKEALSHAAPRTVRFASGDVIVAAGDRFSAIGIVAEGEIAIARGGEHRKVLHRTLGRGEIFGASSLFGNEGGFPTTVTAPNGATVILLGEKDVRAMMTAVPRVAENYIRMLTGKIRFLNRRLDTLAGRSAEERVAEHLLHDIGADGSLGITKSALASLLGLGRASLYRILDLFEEKGWIKPHRDRIELTDAAALKEFIKSRKES